MNLTALWPGSGYLACPPTSPLSLLLRPVPVSVAPLAANIPSNPCLAMAPFLPQSLQSSLERGTLPPPCARLVISAHWPVFTGP